MNFNSDKNWQRQTLGIIIPSFLTLSLFLSGYLFLLLPSFEKTFYNKKCEHLKEITDMAMQQMESLVSDYSQDPDLSSKDKALHFFENLRYGDNEDQYFWILDRSGNMLMHPYVKRFEGTNVSEHKDPQGKYMFQEMIDSVSERGSGMINYSWQYGEDSLRMARKSSYVTEYENWGWIVGTGLYIDDIEEEVETVTHKISILSLAIFVIIAFLIIYLSRTSLSIEKKRAFAEMERENTVKELKEALEKVTQLQGLLPICSKCKKIRDDGGYWQEVELYIKDHTEAEFTHGLCPNCQSEYFKELDDVLKNENNKDS